MLKIIFLIIVLIYLYHDYKADKGRHIKAKAFNALIIILIIFLYGNSFIYLGRMVRFPEKMLEAWNVDYGIIPAGFNFVKNIVNVILGIAMVVSVAGMSIRKIKAQKRFVKLMPVMAIIEVISFVGGWTSEGNNSLTIKVLAFVLGFILFGGIAYLIIRIYGSEFMESYFNREDLNTIRNKKLKKLNSLDAEL